MVRINFNSIIKNAKELANNAARFASKNKHALIEGGLAGLLTYVGIDSRLKEKKHQEKDRLYQKVIQKQDSEMEVLKDAIDEVEELKRINSVLVDAIEEIKSDELKVDSNIS